MCTATCFFVQTKKQKMGKNKNKKSEVFKTPFKNINLKVVPDETMIDPKFQKCYDYGVNLEKNTATYIIPLTEEVSGYMIKVDLSEDGKSVSVYADNILPFIKGDFNQPVKLLKKELKASDKQNEKGEREKAFCITFQFENEKQGLIIFKPYKETEEIDPKSAFFLSRFFAAKPDSQSQGFTLYFLTKSASMGFVLAMVFLGQLQLREKAPQLIEQAHYLFGISIEYYHSPMAKLVYAQEIFNNTPDQYEYALQLLEEACESGFEPAKTYLGQVLSPLSSIPSPKKDAEESFKLLSEGIKSNESVAYHELAKFYYKGVLVEQDLEKANKYQAKAKELNPSIEELDEDEKQNKTYKNSKNVFIYGILAIVVLVLAMFFVK